MNLYLQQFSIWQNDDGNYGISATVNKDNQVVEWIVSPQYWKLTFRPTHNAFT